jgi:CRP-like cAMP-binding protein
MLDTAKLVFGDISRFLTYLRFGQEEPVEWGGGMSQLGPPPAPEGGGRLQPRWGRPVRLWEARRLGPGPGAAGCGPAFPGRCALAHGKNLCSFRLSRIAARSRRRLFGPQVAGLGVIGNLSLTSLTLKLKRLNDLADEELKALETINMATRIVGRGDDILREGSHPASISILMKGIACRYKVLPQGERQITSLCTPGDICNLQTLMFDELDHNVGALSECVVGLAATERVGRLVRSFAGIRAALVKDAIIEAAMAREWILNVGRRSSYEAVAHLLCEIVARLSNVDNESRSEYSTGLTQANIADCIGISNVHVNRVLKKMAKGGFISFERGNLSVHDWTALQDAAGFNPAYLRPSAKA